MSPTSVPCFRRDFSGSFSNALRYSGECVGLYRNFIKSSPIWIVPSDLLSTFKGDSPSVDLFKCFQALGEPPTGIHDVRLRYNIKVLIVLFWSLLSIPANVSRSIAGRRTKRMFGLLLKAGCNNLVNADNAAGAWCAKLTAVMSSARVAKSMKAGVARAGSIWDKYNIAASPARPTCPFLL